MKALTEKKRVTRKNAWGGDGTFDEQTFEIEESDIGAQKPNYLGHGHATYHIRKADVGRKINMQTSPGWACWSFFQEAP
jgi:hypothetical protein